MFWWHSCCSVPPFFILNMDRYGIPYMGSKNKIADWVLSYLPRAENFYDLFCGGCAITHCAMTTDKYKHFFINDIKSEMPTLFLDCINGKYANETRWISKNDFDRLKGTGDAYVDICFSFGNNWRKGYAYSKDIEPFKKAFHYAVFFDDYSLMKEDYNIDLSHLSYIDGFYNKYINAKKCIEIGLNTSLQYLESFTRLQSLERLKTLQRIESFGYTITPSFNSYDCVSIRENSVIYCDIPYRSTATYNDFEFDYDKFYDWALSQKEPIFISEYDMTSDFICIAEKEKICQLSATNNALKSTERIFVPKHQYELVKPLTLFDF